MIYDRSTGALCASPWDAEALSARNSSQRDLLTATEYAAHAKKGSQTSMVSLNEIPEELRKKRNSRVANGGVVVTREDATASSREPLSPVLEKHYNRPLFTNASGEFLIPPGPIGSAESTQRKPLQKSLGLSGDLSHISSQFLGNFKVAVDDKDRGPPTFGRNVKIVQQSRCEVSLPISSRSEEDFSQTHDPPEKKPKGDTMGKDASWSNSYRWKASFLPRTTKNRQSPTSVVSDATFVNTFGRGRAAQGETNFRSRDGVVRIQARQAAAL